MENEVLRTPIKVGNITLKNRLVMPPMATEKSKDGIVSSALLDYYDRMTAGGYLGLVIQEHSYVSKEGQASPNQVSIASDEDIEGLRGIVEVIHKNGVPVIAQLAHAGSAAKEAITGLVPISASATLNPCNTSARMGRQALPKEMDQKEIDRIIKCFADAAVRAKDAGYDGVEIHSAHGYLLDQFYSPLTNKRTDDYTGSTLEGRTLLHVQIIHAVREAVGQDMIVSVRLGASDYTSGGADVTEVAEAAKILADAGLDMISISGGMCDFLRPGHNEPGWFAELSKEARRSGLPVLLTGGISTGEEAEKLLEEGAADMIGIGRAFLRNPALPHQIMTK